MMDEDTVKGDLRQLSRRIKQKWNRLNDYDLMRAYGSIGYLYGKLREYYGLSRYEVEKALQALGFQAPEPDRFVSRTNSDTQRGSARGAPSRTGR